MGKLFISFLLLTSSLLFSSYSPEKEELKKLRKEGTLYSPNEIKLTEKKGLDKAKLVLSEDKNFHFLVGGTLYYKVVSLKEKARRERKKIKIHLFNLFDYVKKKNKDLKLEHIFWISEDIETLPVALAEPLTARAVRVPGSQFK